MGQYFLLRMFFLPIILLIGLMLVFSKVFEKTSIFTNLDLNKKYSRIQVIITFLFISIWVLRTITGVMILNQVVFNCIFIIGYITTAFFYIGINKNLIRPWIKFSILFISITLWLPLSIVVNPIGWYIIAGHTRSMLGLESELIYENENYRIEQLGLVHSSGGQHTYQVIKKSYVYEKKIDEFIEFPPRIDQRVNSYIDKPNK